MPAILCATCLDAEQVGGSPEQDLVGPLLPVLMPWLVTRRWFSHERGHLERLGAVGTSVLEEPGREAVLLHALLDARYEGSGTHHYQLLVGLRRTLPESLAGARIGRVEAGRWAGWSLYEGTEDRELMERLLARTERGEGERLRLSLTGPDRLPGGLSARALAVEQSNSTVVYGNRLLFKLFRQPQAGEHPETDVLRGLTRVNCARIPGLVGWLHTEDQARQPVVLGVLEEFLPSRGDGWDLAVRQAADCVSGSCRVIPALDGFTDEAGELGRAVAEVHAALAEAFGRQELGPAEIVGLVDRMRLDLRTALDRVPGLEPYGGRLQALYEDFGKLAVRGRGLPGQRIHGDLHLGQVLRTEDGWKVIDFEGEPTRPVAERRLPQPVLKDVAGMLRSFDYAGRQALVTLAGEEETGGAVRESAEQTAARLRRLRRAYAWSVRNRRAFTAGYAAAGQVDPYCHPVVLRAFEAEKAVYEAVYESQHRPAWLPIPLAAVQRLVTGR
jgi:maltokinase